MAEQLNIMLSGTQSPNQTDIAKTFLETGAEVDSLDDVNC
jgi:hypothetical protein